MAIQLRRGQTSLWETQNPTLEDGQVGIEKRADLPPRLKIGDGTTNWNNLGYASPDPNMYQDKKIVYNGTEVISSSVGELKLKPVPGALSTPDETTYIRLTKTVGGSKFQVWVDGDVSMGASTTIGRSDEDGMDVGLYGNDFINLGLPNHKWKNVYANKVTIGSLALVYDSDANSINVENA